MKIRPLNTPIIKHSKIAPKKLTSKEVISKFPKTAEEINTTGEELGYYTANGRHIRVIFPR